MFVTAFLAATVLPAQSEIVLVALQESGRYNPVALFLAATTGNVLGSVVNWAMGWQVARYRDRRWFPVSGAALDRATRWYQKYGYWSLLLAWAPIIGDPLTVVAGVLREKFWIFLTLVTIGKGARYAVLMLAL